jgi:hypothetical protein
MEDKYKGKKVIYSNTDGPDSAFFIVCGDKVPKAFQAYPVKIGHNSSFNGGYHIFCRAKK